MPQQGKCPPHPVERDVDADSGHDRPGRPGRGGVTARQPHLERHQAGLDREPAEQQHQRGGPRRAAGHTRERGQRDRVRFAGQEQQPRQQRGPADLAERERDLRRPRPARPAALEPGEQVERDGQRLPSEQRGERVGGRHEHRDRADREGVASAQAPAADRAGPAAQLANATETGTAAPSAMTRNIPDSRSADSPSACCPGSTWPSSRPVPRRTAVPGERGPAGRGQASAAGGAEQVRRPAHPSPPRPGETEQVRRRGSGQQHQPGPNSQLTASPSRCCRGGPRRSAGH